MPKIRWIMWAGHCWRLSALAAAYSLKPQTLAARIYRGMSIERALATGLVDAAEAGRRGARAGRWRGGDD